MNKKIYVLLVGYIFIILLSCSTYSFSPYLITSNGEMLSEFEINQLKKFGYDSLYELDKLDSENLAIMTKSKVINSYSIDKYIKQVTIYEDDILIDRSKSEISKIEYDSQEEIDMLDQFQFTENKEVFESSSGKGFEFEIIDDGGGYAPPTKTKYEITEYKHFTLYGVYYSYLGNAGEFYIKTTMEWKITPTMTYDDIISIAFTDNVQLTDKYYSNKQQYYPKINSKFTYLNDYKNSQVPQSNWYTGKSIEIEVDGSDISKYQYDIGQKYLAVNYDLPKSESWNWGQYSGFDRYYGFEFTLEATFIPLTTNINAATFAGWHAHQTGLGIFDWSKVSLSTSAPFFSYATNPLVIDPSYDSGIGGNIIFSNL